MCRVRKPKCVEGLDTESFHVWYVSHRPGGYFVQSKSGTVDEKHGQFVSAEDAQEYHDDRFNEFDGEPDDDHESRGAFLFAMARWMKTDRRGADFGRLASLLSEVYQIATRLRLEHPRMCECPGCLYLMAMDEVRPGVRKFIWDGIDELPDSVKELSAALGLNFPRDRTDLGKRFRRAKVEAAARPRLMYVLPSQVVPAGS
ncbi:hypothetical protein [Limnoglobus roseus]|uniref:Uncharacterized protein n=1 Tax=Limnoglobus roseus TaxID=2598579 RepID=A0A5C1AJY2_9BACT|nr:hypothetical protein [Limnoglobus roseus]QEL18326.1 hypothetical protein PX52LOC_05347 [Limnoglobus roseus]